METLTDDQIFKIRRNLSDAGCGVPLIESSFCWSKITGGKNSTVFCPSIGFPCWRHCIRTSTKSTASTTWSMPWRKRTKNR